MNISDNTDNAKGIEFMLNEAVYVRVLKLVFVKHFLKKGYCKRVIFHYGRKKEYTQKDI